MQFNEIKQSNKIKTQINETQIEATKLTEMAETRKTRLIINQKNKPTE